MANTSLGIPLPPDGTRMSQTFATQRDGFQKIDDLLQGDLSAELVEQIADAAGAALETAATNADFVQGDDTRVMRSINSTAYAIATADADGYIAGGWMQDGTHNTELPPRVMGSQGVTAQPIIAPGWAYVHADADGYVAFGIREDGTVVAPKGQMDATTVANDALGLTRTRRDAASTIGDSLTYGFFGGAAGPQADAWPARLATLAGGITVSNIAMSGFTIDEESIRIGALPLPLTVSGGEIPASGPVTVTTPVTVGWREVARIINFTGTLANVPGTLGRAADGTLTFNRTAAGTAVTVPAGTVFVPTDAGHDAETLIIMLGRNNVSYNVPGADASVAEHVVNGIRRIVNWQSRQLKQVLVMSVTTMTTETSSTAGYATVTAINDALATEYGTRYFDLRAYLVQQAIHDLGITPTSEDLANMAADTLPPSIMDPGASGTGDATHYSKATAALVGEQVYQWLTLRDWITA